MFLKIFFLLSFFYITIDAKDSWLIFPGTKWCGKGNKAKNYNDLGTEIATDKCCRDHDKCSDIISAGGSNHGLKNPTFYTRLHCNCDQKFFACLKAANTKMSKEVGSIYFDVLGTKCFREDFPTKGCANFSQGRCLKYNFDKSKPKKYQWFDVSLF